MVNMTNFFVPLAKKTDFNVSVKHIQSVIEILEDCDPKASGAAGRSQFIDMLNSTPAIAAPAAESVSSPAKRRGPKKSASKARKTGSVDAGRGRRKAKSGIKEI